MDSFFVFIFDSYVNVILISALYRLVQGAAKNLNCFLYMVKM